MDLVALPDLLRDRRGIIFLASTAESGEDEEAWPIVFTMALLVTIFIVALYPSRLEVTCPLRM